MRFATKAIAGFSAALSLVVAGEALAQTFPVRPMRMIIGYGAGGVTDVVCRIVADDLGKKLGQSMVVENRPGAGGLVAAQAVKAAAPDGYTLYGGSVTPIHPALAKAGMDAVKELTPIGTFAYGDLFIYVAASTGAKSVKELAAWAKANPGKMRFATPSPQNTLMFAVVAKRLGFNFDTIPYKATDQSTASIAAGDTTATTGATAGYDQYIKAGTINVIATFSASRSPVRPDVPTVKEQGVDMGVGVSHGLWGPLGLSSEVVARLNAAIRETLKTPQVVERMRAASLLPLAGTPEDMVRDVNNEIGYYREAAQMIGYQPQ